MLITHFERGSSQDAPRFSDASGDPLLKEEHQMEERLDETPHDQAAEFPPESERWPRRPSSEKRTLASWLRIGCVVFVIWTMAGILICGYSVYSRISRAGAPRSSLSGHPFVVVARDLSRRQNQKVLRLRVTSVDGRTTALPPLQENCLNWTAWLSLEVGQMIWFCPQNPALQIFGSEDLSRTVYPCGPDPAR
jgi:hypothetical protein